MKMKNWIKEPYWPYTEEKQEKLAARSIETAPAIFPSVWASGWGEDEFGAWNSFTVKGVTQIMRWIPPGSFMMGSPTEEKERLTREHQHNVTLTQGFWLGDTACTQALWKAVMSDDAKNDPSKFKGDDLPVEQVSWDDSWGFFKKINTFLPGLQLCLPTEAQWEYACRAESKTPFFWGENITTDQVNYDGNYPYNNGKKGEYREKTVPVTSLPPNGWGLYQMHGNVWEWCNDRFEEGYYKGSPEKDPLGPSSGNWRVRRGGSWDLIGGWCRSASRYGWIPVRRDILTGFRFAQGQ
jgi:formylglycine-generating enzyme required for sulfatase activity